MPSYSKFARLIVAAFIIAVLAATLIRPPQPVAPSKPGTDASLSLEIVDEILMAYADVLIRNGQAG